MTHHILTISNYLQSPIFEIIKAIEKVITFFSTIGARHKIYIQTLKELNQLSEKELADIGALNAVPFSATARIGLEEATHQIENWISPKVVP